MEGGIKALSWWEEDFMNMNMSPDLGHGEVPGAAPRKEQDSQGQPGSKLCVMDHGGTRSGWDAPPSASAAL